MKKIHLIVGLVAGGAALMLLSIFVILATKGQLNMETLSRMPILGRFFGEYVPPVIQTAGPRDPAAKKPDPSQPVRELPAPLAMFQYPAPYTAEEMKDLSNQLEESRVAYEKKFGALAQQEEDLVRREKDLERRWEELNGLAAKIEEVRTKVDQDFKALRDQKTNVEADERENIRKIADMFKKMKDAKKVAELLKEMGAAKTVKVLDALNADDEGRKKAGVILAELDADYASEVLNLLSKQKKSAP